METASLLLPLTLCGSSGDVAPNPPLRQAAGRYVPYVLLLWMTERIFSDTINDAGDLYNEREGYMFGFINFSGGGCIC